MMIPRDPLDLYLQVNSSVTKRVPLLNDASSESSRRDRWIFPTPPTIGSVGMDPRLAVEYSVVNL